jgi:hypothetical protein
MKRGLLAACVCGAVALAPASSAYAERALATCEIQGYASFSPHLAVLPTAGLEYNFHGSAVCETLPSREVLKGTVEAAGKETLSCSGSLTEEEGSGTLTFGELKLPFRLKFFAGTPGASDLAATFADGGVAVGSTEFLTSESPRAMSCFSGLGAHELQLKAEATGEM